MDLTSSQSLWGWMPVVNTLALCLLSILGYGWRSAVRKMEQVEGGIATLNTTLVTNNAEIRLALASANTALQVLASQFADHSRADEHAFRNVDQRLNAQRHSFETFAFSAHKVPVVSAKNPVTEGVD